MVNVGDRVEWSQGAECDTGIVWDVLDDLAQVAWDSGVVTWCPIDTLEVEARS